MNLDNFLYNCNLMGYKIMGINNKNLERISLQKLVFQKKQELFRVLYEYFELGVQANIFSQPGKPSGPNGSLWTGFNQGPYIYFVHRQSKNKNQTPLNMNSILNNIIQKNKPIT